MDDGQEAKEEYFNKAQWTVKELRKNSDLVVKPSDKGKGFAEMAKESYVEKVNGILRSDVDYEQILTTTDVLNSEMKKVIKATGKKLWSWRLRPTPKHTKIPQIYGLQKSHKPGLPLRPVVATCYGPSRNMSIILETILYQLLGAYSSSYEKHRGGD